MVWLVVSLVFLAVALIAVGAGVLVWLGLRNGDGPSDARTTVTPLTGGSLRVEVRNPGERVVLVTARVATTAPQLTGPAVVRRTALARRDWRGALLGAVEPYAAASWTIPAPAQVRRHGVRVELAVHQRPGRVRLARHLVAPGEG